MSVTFTAGTVSSGVTLQILTSLEYKASLKKCVSKPEAETCNENLVSEMYFRDNLS